MTVASIAWEPFSPSVLNVLYHEQLRNSPLDNNVLMCATYVIKQSRSSDLCCLRVWSLNYRRKRCFPQLIFALFWP